MVIMGTNVNGLPGIGAAALTASADSSTLRFTEEGATSALPVETEKACHGAVLRTAPPVLPPRLDRIAIIRVRNSDRRKGTVRQAMLAATIPLASTNAGSATAPAVRTASTESSNPPVSVPAAGPPARIDEGGGTGHRQRWSGSAWLLWRDTGNPQAIGSAGQLGGAQAGIRIDRHLGRPFASVPLSAYARLTTALRDPAAPEAAMGLALHPASGRMPVMVGIERRVAFGRDGRDAFAILAATGLNPSRVMGGLIAEGYAQAGMVGLSRKDMFADGRASLIAPLDRSGATGIGVSLSGGAQPELSRLDAGPVFQTRLPLDAVALRLSVEWRQHIAGNARPGSGLAVTLGSDF